MAATFTIEPALERIVRTAELDLVTLDLAAATFIDSVGLGAVIRLAGELEERGVALRILPAHLRFSGVREPPRRTGRRSSPVSPAACRRQPV